MKKFKVIIPEEEYSILEFEQEDLPGVAVINSALRDFEPKQVFSWHLSIMLELEDLAENGMPSPQEQEIVDEFGDKLDALIKGPNKEKPNALFLARITWNETRELIWRVFDPEIANNDIQQIIKGGNTPRQFDYRMDDDEDWKMTEWHLKEY
ncbi:DUF695 domain-containing protein [Pontibacter vulgaris]|uniref:DUF695 domain-containing protein n=1 Tax=Pontibacter vulgaris TaxID=2905679 RepID=UPI001FA7CD47|nr:DUF695 domain-containing protein [Pontibacter vulgaris]